MLIRFGGILFLVLVVFWLFCLLDAITTKADRVRGLPKAVWVAVILLMFTLGAVLWLMFGRPKSTGPRGSSRRRPLPGLPAPPAPRAPDDDPEFLSRLDDQARRERRRQLDRWEEDLRRREENLRRREGGDEPNASHPGD